MKHTKGPWTYSERIDEGYRIHTAEGGMADAIANIDEWQTKEETEANARLIAVAPELLEALKQVLKEYAPAGLPDQRAEVIMAYQAIAKAGGR